MWGFGLVWFLFYGPSTHFRSFRARSVNLATLGSLPVLSAHSFASSWQLLLLNQRKRENGRRNVFMTKSPRKNVPDVGIELGAACMPSELASDRATAPCMWGTPILHENTKKIRWSSEFPRSIPPLLCVTYMAELGYSFWIFSSKVTVSVSVVNIIVKWPLNRKKNDFIAEQTFLATPYSIQFRS